MTCVPCGSFNADAIRPLNDVEVKPEEGATVAEEGATFAEEGATFEASREQEYGVRNPRKLLGPKLPTQKDVDGH